MPFTHADRAPASGGRGGATQILSIASFFLSLSQTHTEHSFCTQLHRQACVICSLMVETSVWPTCTKGSPEKQSSLLLAWHNAIPCPVNTVKALAKLEPLPDKLLSRVCLTKKEGMYVPGILRESANVSSYVLHKNALNSCLGCSFCFFLPHIKKNIARYTCSTKLLMCCDVEWYPGCNFQRLF